MQLLNPNDPNVRTAAFGRQVELFLQTDIGVYLMDYARREELLAVEDLKRADPLDAKAVMAAQMKARIADYFMAWLGEAVASGESAKLVLEEEQAEERNG